MKFGFYYSRIATIINFIACVLLFEYFLNENGISNQPVATLVNLRMYLLSPYLINFTFVIQKASDRCRSKLNIGRA